VLCARARSPGAESTWNCTSTTLASDCLALHATLSRRTARRGGARRCSFRTSTFGSRRTTMRSSGSTDHTPPRKIASVLNGAGSPDRRYSFVRGTMGDEGVSVIRPTRFHRRGELRGDLRRRRRRSRPRHAAQPGAQRRPFGYRTFESLALEAGSPLFHTELEGTLPERARPPKRAGFRERVLRGSGGRLPRRESRPAQPATRRADAQDGKSGDRPVPDAGAAVFDGDASVGEVTRAGEPDAR